MTIELLLTAMLALVLVLVVLFVQRQIPRFTKPGARLWFSRSVLLFAAIAFGWAGAVNVQGGLAQTIAFLIGFGVVHVPAAVILFIKGRRGSGKT